jgi:hypothetical protein
MSTFNCWMCRHQNIKQSKDKILIDSILKEELILECPICYDIFDSDNLFFTECKHYACYKCTNSIIKKILDDNFIPLRSTIGYFQQYNEYIDSIPSQSINYDEYIGQLPINSRDPFIQIIIYNNNIYNNNININNNNINININ